MKPTIYLASDHAGFELKNELLAFVQHELGYEAVDCGAYVYDEEDDFTDFIADAARKVSAQPELSKAIILGGSGQGEAMLANRFHDVRAAVYYGGEKEIIILSRQHNDANVLSLGARFINEGQAKEAVKLWLATEHATVEKYDRRIEEIEEMSVQKEPQLVLSIVPSLPARSFTELQELGDTLQGVAQGIQVDIVDGAFVPHTSWPFTEAVPQQALDQLAVLTKNFEIEVDCMCMNPGQYLDTLARAGVKRVVIHMGSTADYASCISHAKTHGYKIGLAITNDTPLEDIHEYRRSIDFVQIMGIKNIGVQGQPFDERTLETVKKLRTLDPFLEIAVDGAVNVNTIPSLLQSGVNRFAPGSAITQAADPAHAYTQLSQLIDR